MKKYLISQALIIFFSCNLFAQQKVNNIGLQSLEILNQKLHLNLKKENEPILITIDDLDFICLEYMDKKKLPSILILKRRYKLNKVGNNKYEFVLKGASEYNGTFELSGTDDNQKFVNLKYVKRDD